MSNERGNYGPNGHNSPYGTWRGYGSPRLGAEIYVEKPSSAWKWILGGLAVGGAILWARHTSEEIDTLFKKTGMSRQGFVDSLREGARTLPGRTRAAIRGFSHGGTGRGGLAVEGPKEGGET